MKTKRSLNQMCVLGALLLHALNSPAQPVTKVVVGQDYSLFLKGDGSLWGMGNNFAGQLGNGTHIGTNQPMLMVGSNVTAMAGGANHTLFTKSNGSLWAMGANNAHQIGDGTGGVTDLYQLVPKQIENSGVTAIAAGNDHSLIIKGGSLFTFGDNHWGQLGNGTFDSATNFLPERIVEGGVMAVAAGYRHSLFLMSNGSLWGMGENQSGQLGIGTYSTTFPNGINQPMQIATSNVNAIAAGASHSLFLRSDGSLWAMGNNSSSQLGDGTFNTTNRPVLIVASNVTAIAAGLGHSLFLKSDGSLWGMGQNGPQLGLEAGLGSYITTPTRIISGGVTAIAAGHVHSLFTKCDGSLWAMGGNNQGQLGIGTYTGLAKPEPILAAPGYNRIIGELSLGGRWRFSYVGIAGLNYALDRTFSLSPPDWLPQVTNTADDCGALWFTNTPSPGTNNFWRIRSAQ